MKFLIVTLALLGAVAADVKHLNNMYLPPHMAHLAGHSHVAYAQQSQEVPEVSLSLDAPTEIVDNSVSEDVVSHGHDEYSVPAPGSDTLVEEQAAYWTSVSQQQESAAVVEPQAPEPEAAPAVVEEQHEEAAVESQPEEPEQKYYTGLVYKPEQDVAPAHAPVLGAAASGIDTHYAADGGYVY